MGREESELDSRYAVFPVPSRESKPNGPKGSWTPAGARQRDLVLSMQAEDEALGFLKDDSFTVEQFQETTVMGEKGIGSYWEKSWKTQMILYPSPPRKAGSSSGR